jgi:hypothetical protein
VLCYTFLNRSEANSNCYRAGTQTGLTSDSRNSLRFHRTAALYGAAKGAQANHGSSFADSPPSPSDPLDTRKGPSGNRKKNARPDTLTHDRIPGFRSVYGLDEDIFFDGAHPDDLIIVSVILPLLHPIVLTLFKCYGDDWSRKEHCESVCRCLQAHF